MHNDEAPEGNPARANDAHGHELIQQLMLKPSSNIVLDAAQQLTAVYVAQLQAEAGEIHLSYVRPMAMGVHVLGLEPAVERDAAVELAKLLTARSDVEYAEPDFPRHRR